MHKDHTAQAKQKKDEREEVLKEIRQLENRQKILENKQRNEERKLTHLCQGKAGLYRNL